MFCVCDYLHVNASGRGKDWQLCSATVMPMPAYDWPRVVEHGYRWSPWETRGDGRRVATPVAYGKGGRPAGSLGTQNSH